MGICAMHHDWESVGSRCVEFKEGEIKWLGGRDAYDKVVLEGNTGVSETPEQAIERLNAHINTDSR
jgi:hypothetical protein